MIKLSKRPEPQILVDNAEAWTAIIVQKNADGIDLTNAEKTRYRHAQVKAVLVDETAGKCAYCESKLLHIHHGDVEHIVPKSLRPELSVEWDNLTLACEVCNQKKSNLDPLATNIIDPYVTDPADHLAFVGALVISRGTIPGTSTRSILDLNRGELSERRRERLEALLVVVEQIMRADLPMVARRALYQNLLQQDAGTTAPYSAMAKSMIAQFKDQLPEEVTSSGQ